MSRIAHTVRLRSAHQFGYYTDLRFFTGANIVSMVGCGIVVLAAFTLAAQFTGDDDEERIAAFVLAGFFSTPIFVVGFIMQACFLWSKVCYNRSRAIEKGVEGRQGYMRLQGNEELRYEPRGADAV